MDTFRQVILYAVAVGLSIRVLAFVWRSFWAVYISPREGVALAGATIAWLVVWGIARGPVKASLSSGIIIVSYFVLKLIKSRWQ